MIFVYQKVSRVGTTPLVFSVLMISSTPRIQINQTASKMCLRKMIGLTA